MVHFSFAVVAEVPALCSDHRHLSWRRTGNLPIDTAPVFISMSGRRRVWRANPALAVA
jgi:hypothetical protein